MMRHQIFIALLFMVICTSAAVAADCSPTISVVPELPSIARGQTVTVQGDCLPKQGVKVVLRTGKEKQGDKGLLPLDAKNDAWGTGKKPSSSIAVWRPQEPRYAWAWKPVAMPDGSSVCWPS
jgi:hypothetical protein